MKTLPHRLNTVKCKLNLPYFESEANNEKVTVKLMNSFTSLIEEKVTQYANDPKSNVRTYKTDFSVETKNGLTFVHICLTARLLIPSKGIKPCKKEMICRWKGSRLISVTVI